jgi:hypothetical protein
MRQLPLIVLLACAACSSGASGPGAAPARAPVGSGSPLAQIRSLVGIAACTDSSECRTVALGARACGGPESYLPWSSAQTEAAPLAALTERYKQQRQAELAKSGEQGDCRFIADPGAQCRAGSCQLRISGPDPT